MTDEATPRTRASGSPSGPPATAARRCEAASTRTTSSPRARRSASTAPPGHHRPALPRQGHARALRAGERTALEVLAANGVEVRIEAGAALHAHAGDLARDPHLQPRPDASDLADGIVVTPSHNPPEDGGFKYNPPDGRPGRHRRHAADRSARQRATRGRPPRREAGALRRSAPAPPPRSDHDFVAPYVGGPGLASSTSRPSAARARDRRRSAGRRRRRLLGADRRAVRPRRSTS